MGAQDRSVFTSGVRAAGDRARRGMAVCAAVAVVSCVAGCGGSSTSSRTEAEKWADDVCSSVSTWRDTVSQARSTLSHPATLSVSRFEDTVRGVVQATRTLVTDVGNLGPPDTTAGNQAADEVANLSDRLDKEMAVLKKTVGAHPGSLSEVLADLSTVTGSLATMSADIKTTLDDLGSLDGADELRDAFDSSASCQKLTPGSSPT